MLSNMTHYSDFLLTEGSIFFSDFFSNSRTAILEEVNKMDLQHGDSSLLEQQ